MAKDNNQCGVGVAYNSNIGCKYLYIRIPTFNHTFIIIRGVARHPGFRSHKAALAHIFGAMPTSGDTPLIYGYAPRLMPTDRRLAEDVIEVT